MPSTPRGWLNWSESVLERYGRPHGARYEYDGYTDRRLSDRRETALSVRIILERASKETTRNGVGVELLRRFYIGEASWWTFTEPEQAILRKTIRHFSGALREAGFLPDRGKGTPGGDDVL